MSKHLNLQSNEVKLDSLLVLSIFYPFSIDSLLVLSIASSSVRSPSVGILPPPECNDRRSLPEENRNGAHHTAERDVRTETFADSCELPEDAQEAGLVSVDHRRHQSAEVGTGADQQQNDDDETLEVEESRLPVRIGLDSDLDVDLVVDSI